MAEAWQQDKIGSIMWMFSGAKQIEQDMKDMLDTMHGILSKQPTVKAILACQSAVKKHEKLAWTMVKLQGVSKDIEEPSLTPDVMSVKLDQSATTRHRFIEN